MNAKTFVMMAGIPVITTILAVTYSTHEATSDPNPWRRVLLGWPHRAVTAIHELGHLFAAIFTNGEIISEKYGTDDGTPAHIAAYFRENASFGVAVMLLGPMLLLWPAAILLYVVAWTHALPVWQLACVVALVPVLLVAGVLSPYDYRALGFFGKYFVFSTWALIPLYTYQVASIFDYSKVLAG